MRTTRKNTYLSPAPMTLRLWRSNEHVSPNIARDVCDIVQIAVLAFLLYLIAIMVPA